MTKSDTVKSLNLGSQFDRYIIIYEHRWNKKHVMTNILLFHIIIKYNQYSGDIGHVQCSIKTSVSCLRNRTSFLLGFHLNWCSNHCYLSTTSPFTDWVEVKISAVGNSQSHHFFNNFFLSSSLSHQKSHTNNSLQIFTVANINSSACLVQSGSVSSLDVLMPHFMHCPKLTGTHIAGPVMSLSTTKCESYM